MSDLLPSFDELNAPFVELSFLGPRNDPYQWVPLKWIDWDEEEHMPYERQGILREVWQVNGKYFAVTQGISGFLKHELFEGRINPFECPKRFSTIEELRMALVSVPLPEKPAPGLPESLNTIAEALVFFGESGLPVYRSDIY